MKSMFKIGDLVLVKKSFAMKRSEDNFWYIDAQIYKNEVFSSVATILEVTESHNTEMIYYVLLGEELEKKYFPERAIIRFE